MKRSPAGPNRGTKLTPRRMAALGITAAVTVATAGVAQAYAHGSSSGNSTRDSVSAAGYSSHGRSLGYYQAYWGGYSSGSGWNNDKAQGHGYGTWNGFKVWVPGQLMPPTGNRMRTALVAQGVLNFVCVAGTFVQTGPAQKLSTTAGRVAGIHFAATPVTAAAATNPAASFNAAWTAANATVPTTTPNTTNPNTAWTTPSGAAAMAAAAGVAPSSAPMFGGAAAAGTTTTFPILGAPIAAGITSWQSIQDGTRVDAVAVGQIPSRRTVPAVLFQAVNNTGFGGQFGNTRFIVQLPVTGGMPPAVCGVPGQRIAVPFTAIDLFFAGITGTTTQQNLQNQTPVTPANPVTPTTPANPVAPANPVTPANPAAPTPFVTPFAAG